MMAGEELPRDGFIDVYLEFPPDHPMNLHRRVYSMDAVQENKEFLLTCPLCKENFASKNAVCGHGRNVHLKQFSVTDDNEVVVGEGILVKCTQCNFVAKRKGRITRHLKEKHDIIEEIKCEFCGKKFKSHRACHHHVLQFHTYNDMPCELCGKVCKNRSAFQRHKLMHIRSFSCEQCGKSFQDRRCYTQHIKIHKARTPYKCSQCEKTFTQKSNMLSHVKIQHNKEGKLSCDVCQFSTFYKDVLVSHIDRVHKKLKKAKYVCSYCSKTFERRLVFDEHIDKHEGRYRYSCQYCAKRFRNKARCKSHVALCEFSSQEIIPNSHETVNLQVFSSLDDDDVIEETDVGLGAILV